MTRAKYIVGFAALAALAVVGPLAAQQGTGPIGAQVVASCGTPRSTYTAGQIKPITQDTTGANCISGTINASTAAHATAVAPTYVEGTDDALSQDLSGGLRVNCIVGCAGGTASNASSGVATSSTNGTTNAWLYGFNGTTWDQLLVDGSKFLKVNVAAGTVTAAQATAANLNATVVGTGTFAVQAAESGTWNITNVSGTVSLPTGAATAAKQPALGTAGSSSADVISVQGIASGTALPVSAASLPLPSGAATSALQSVTQAVIGVATAPTTMSVIGGVYNSTPLTLTDGKSSAMQFDTKGQLKGVVRDAAGNDRGANVNASNQLSVSVDNSNVSANIAQINGVTPLMGNGATGTGALRVSIANDSTGIVALTTGSAQIGHLEANQSSNIAQINGVAPTMGNGASGTGVQRVTIANDSTGIVSLTTSAATIGALVANQSVNTAQINGVAPLMGNGATGTGALRVSIANDSTGVVQPGNTANTTPWLVQAVPGAAAGLSTYVVEPTASDNHVVIKAGAGVVYHIGAQNNSATVNYLRLYNATTGFNGCNSATNLLWETIIPANTSGAGYVEDIAMGITASTGISICITGAYGNTSTTSATASALVVNVGYK